MTQTRAGNLWSRLLCLLPNKSRMSTANRFLTEQMLPGFEPSGLQDQLLFSLSSPYDQFYESWTKSGSSVGESKKSLCHLRFFLHCHLLPEDNIWELSESCHLGFETQQRELKTSPSTFSGRTIGDCCWAMPHHSWCPGDPLQLRVSVGNANFGLSISGEEATPEFAEELALAACDRLENWIRPNSWQRSFYSVCRTLQLKLSLYSR